MSESGVLPLELPYFWPLAGGECISHCRCQYCESILRETSDGWPSGAPVAHDASGSLHRNQYHVRHGLPSVRASKKGLSSSCVFRHQRGSSWPQTSKYAQAAWGVSFDSGLGI